jgi:hypothetical protein
MYVQAAIGTLTGELQECKCGKNVPLLLIKHVQATLVKYSVNEET